MRLLVERFTEIGRSTPWSRQWRACSSTRPSTSAVIARIWPVPSASGTNSSGGIGPCCGCSQRSERLDAGEAARSRGRPSVGRRPRAGRRRSRSAARRRARGGGCCAGCGRRRRSRCRRRPSPSRCTSRCRRAGAASTTSVPCAGAIAMPIAALTASCTWSTTIGCCSATWIRDAISSACESLRSWGRSTTNSSPPSRAIRPGSGSTMPIRCATSWRSRSPWWCPSVSLTSLNRLRSISITPTLHPPAAALAERVVGAGDEEVAVGETGERVVQRLVLLLRHLGAQPFDRAGRSRSRCRSGGRASRTPSRLPRRRSSRRRGGCARRACRR